MSKLSPELINAIKSAAACMSIPKETKEQFKARQDEERVRTRKIYPIDVFLKEFPGIRFFTSYCNSLKRTLIIAESSDKSSHLFIRGSKFIQNNPTKIKYIIAQEAIDYKEIFALSGIPKSWKKYLPQPEVETIWGWMGEHLSLRVTPSLAVRDLIIYALMLGYNSYSEVIKAVEKNNPDYKDHNIISITSDFLELEYLKLTHKMPMSEIATRTADAWNKFASIPELNK